MPGGGNSAKRHLTGTWSDTGRSAPSLTHPQQRRGRYLDTLQLWSGLSLCLWCSSARRTYRPMYCPDRSCSPKLCTQGAKRKKMLSFNPSATTPYTHADSAWQPSFIPEAQPEGRFLPLLQCFRSPSTVVHSRHTGSIWGMRDKSTVACAMNHNKCNASIKPAVTSANLKLYMNTKVRGQMILYEMMTWDFNFFNGCRISNFVDRVTNILESNFINYAQRDLWLLWQLIWACVKWLRLPLQVFSHYALTLKYSIKHCLAVRCYFNEAHNVLCLTRQSRGVD